MTGINTITSSQNVHNEKFPRLETIARTSSPILPETSNLTFEDQTQGKRKYVNIFELDSDTDDPFYKTNSSTTMSNLSLNTSTVNLSLTLETDNEILVASSSCEK